MVVGWRCTLFNPLMHLWMDIASFKLRRASTAATTWQPEFPDPLVELQISCMIYKFYNVSYAIFEFWSFRFRCASLIWWFCAYFCAISLLIRRALCPLPTIHISSISNAQRWIGNFSCRKHSAGKQLAGYQKKLSSCDSWWWLLVCYGDSGHGYLLMLILSSKVTWS